MDELNILFWNIGKNDLSLLIAQFVQKYNIDVLVLIEDNISKTKMLSLLNQDIARYNFCKGNDRGISIYTSFGIESFAFRKTASEFISFVEFTFLRKHILFGAMHFPSKLRISAVEQALIARDLKKEIESMEMASRHNNTLLVGDFNMNPFEAGMVEADAFNASMSRKIAGVNYRKVSGLGLGQSKDYQYFYNPMWSFLGDLSKYAPGTYYFYDNTIDNHYRWNMLDQVLIRPSLIPNFVVDSLEILETDLSGNKLIDDNKKSKSIKQFCDHLPVVFTLDLTK